MKTSSPYFSSSSSSSFFSYTLLLLAFALQISLVSGQSDDANCVYPGTCQPPSSYKYVRGRDVVPRTQWTISGGFCGAVSIQAIALSYGAWISQDLIRKAAPSGGGHGNEQEGYEILHTNIEAALTNLKLSYVSWDFNQPQPQGLQYLKWLKSELVSNRAVVQFVLCQGDSHRSYGVGPYDHIEPFFKIYTNQSLDDPLPFPGDVITHGSDYDPDGENNLGYFRAMSSLLDTLEMDGNCKEAGDKFGENEMYPCIYDQVTYGYSMTGLVQGEEDQALTAYTNETQAPKAEDLVLFVNATDEPDIRRGEDPYVLQTRLVVNSLIPKESYAIFRYDTVSLFPTNGDYFNEPYSFLYTFVADESGSYEWMDPNTFLSSGSTYYRCVKNIASVKY